MNASVALSVLLLLGAAGDHGHGRVFSFEGTSIPAEPPWVRYVFCDPDRWLDDGWFVQRVGVCVEHPPPGGDSDSYQHPLGDFAGEQRFFVEWRVVTTGPRSEIVGTAPSALVAGSFGPANYHFTIARDQVRFVRDNRLPILYIEMEPDTPHIFRLELFASDLYVWYIDGRVIDRGIPEGPFPTQDTFITIHVRSWHYESTTRWDYVRWGRIPVDGSGDFDSDDDVDLTDFYYVHECAALGGPGVDAGPGCRFADTDSDTDVDLRDFAAFQNRFTGSQ